ncbi:MAG: hypothetical protein ACREOO_26800 [bacterium]
MSEKKLLALRGAPSEKLDAIRDIILGPHLRELERKVEKLARQVEQLQAALDTRGERQTRRAARHRYLTTMKVKKLAQAVETILQYLRTEHEARASSAQRLTTLTRRLQATPGLPATKSARFSAARVHKKAAHHDHKQKLQIPARRWRKSSRR